LAVRGGRLINGRPNAAGRPLLNVAVPQNLFHAILMKKRECDL
jgi:hypothetical protein